VFANSTDNLETKKTPFLSRSGGLRFKACLFLPRHIQTRRRGYDAGGLLAGQGATDSLCLLLPDAGVNVQQRVLVAREAANGLVHRQFAGLDAFGDGAADEFFDFSIEVVCIHFVGGSLP
jgi:hypothetical protein